MGVIINDSELVKERMELHKKLAGTISDEDREKFSKRIGEIGTILSKNIQDKLREGFLNTGKNVTKEEYKLIPMKKVKRLFKEKYQYYRRLTINGRKFVDDCVIKKREGREILDRLKDVKDESEEKKLMMEMLKY